MAYLAYSYIYKDHRDIENEVAKFSMSSIDISNEFEINPSEAEAKYLNKTIEISGAITELNTNQITIDDKVFCLFNNPITNLNLDKKVIVKGRFIGYDDLLEEIKLDQCNIIN